MKLRATHLLLGALAPSLLVFAGSPTARAESGTFSCTITVGYQGAWWDGSTAPVPHAIGGCRLVQRLSEDSVVLGMDTGAGCEVRADVDNDGSHEWGVVVNTAVPAGAAVWAHCDLGVAQRQVSITLESATNRLIPVDPTLARLGSIVPFATAADDGTVLRGDVYLPQGTAPLATVLELSPYWNTSNGPSDRQRAVVNGRPTMAGPYQAFMDAGFAVALVNIRGTGKSDGCMQWATPREWADVSTVVQALAAQPWSNGNVGMFGLSYPAWMQYGAMTTKPPALKAVVPMSGVFDLHSLLTYNGARTLIAPAASGYWTTGTAFGGFAAGHVFSSNRFVPAVGPSHAPCPRYAEDTAAHARLGADGERTAYFEARDLRPALRGTTVPALVTSGLSNSEGSITQFEGLWDTLGGERRFLLGQWGHTIPTRDDFMKLAVGFFDHYLRGAPKTVATGIVEYEDNQGTWHTATRWPPPKVDVPFHLSGTELVRTPEAVVPSARSFQSSGPTIQICGGGDYLRYLSAPLTEDLELAGNFEVDLTLASTLPEGNLQVSVYDITGAGGCADTRVQVARAFTTLRHSATPGYGRDFPVNVAATRTIRSLPFAAKIPAGHRVLVAVDAGSFEILPDARKPRLTVTTGAGAPGVVRLPKVVPDPTTTTTDDDGGKGKNRDKDKDKDKPKDKDEPADGAGGSTEAAGASTGDRGSAGAVGLPPVDGGMQASTMAARRAADEHDDVLMAAAVGAALLGTTGYLALARRRRLGLRDDG